jgi:hypothetical protein
MDFSKIIESLNALREQASQHTSSDFCAGYAMAVRHAIELIEAKQFVDDLMLSVEKGQS